MSAAAACELPSPLPCVRPSRRAALRREVVVPCQAVRERDFKLLADRTLDVSTFGLLLPVAASDVVTGETLIVSFPIPGMWIDAECSVTRVVRGRRPGDEGAHAVGLRFDVIAPSARAALAGFLHGRPPPLPRRGPFARLRRGEAPPHLADQAVMTEMIMSGPALLVANPIRRKSKSGVDPARLLRELAAAWKGLAVPGDETQEPLG